MMRPTVQGRPLPYREQHFRMVYPQVEQVLLGDTNGSRPPPFCHIARPCIRVASGIRQSPIRYHAGQLVIFQHPRPIQILNGDDVETFNEIGRELVQGIRPDVSNQFSFTV